VDDFTFVYCFLVKLLRRAQVFLTYLAIYYYQVYIIDHPILQFSEISRMMKRETSHVSFTDAEAEYLERGRLARLATTSIHGGPHVVPVTYEFDGNHIYFSGWNLERSLKFRNIKANNQVAIVVDDIASVNPWRPRGIEIRGLAEVQENEDGQYVRITPKHKISWGI
jgi:pyridoxamine 5'-phosphate oxidase family protein